MQRIKITTVKSGSHAEQIGLHVGDVLDTLNDIPLQMPDDLTTQLARCSGQRSKLAAYRNGDRVHFDVSAPTLGVIVAAFDMEELLAEQERAKRLAQMIVSTAPHIEGYRVTETLDVISAECVFGVNALKELIAGLTDMIGGRSETVQNVLRDARVQCLRELRREAAQAGANAIISVNLAYNEITGAGKSMLFVVATGTAVKIQPA